MKNLGLLLLVVAFWGGLTQHVSAQERAVEPDVNYQISVHIAAGSNYAPTTGAIIMLYKQVGTSFIFVDTITTDGSLTYVFSNLEAGACYKVTVNLTGYAEQSHIFGSVNGEENAYFHFSAFVVTSIDMEQKLSEQTLFVNRKDD